MNAATESEPTATPDPGTPPEERGPSIFSLPLADLSAGDPLRWLRLGLLDFLQAPAIGLFFGGPDRWGAGATEGSAGAQGSRSSACW